MSRYGAAPGVRQRPTSWETLQLSVDCPDLVRALVAVASANRRGPEGRRVQQELARLTRAGDPVGGFAQLVFALMPTEA